MRLGVRAALAALALAASAPLFGCASSTTSTMPPTSSSGSGSSSQVAAIEAVIAKTSNSNDGFVVFVDASDQAKDGKERTVQMSCDDTQCHFEALCDFASPPCSQVASKLEAHGLKADSKNPGVYFVDRKGNHHDFAVLTDDIFRNVLGASPDYHLTWRSNIQTSPTPL